MAPPNKPITDVILSPDEIGAKNLSVEFELNNEILPRPFGTRQNDTHSRLTRRFKLWISAAASLGLALISFCCIPSEITYEYTAITDGCNCKLFTVKDVPNKITYLFKAVYRLHDAITTIITVEFTNRSRDTLFLDAGSVMISSRNISYQYNGKFLPLPSLKIPPHKTDHITLTGNDKNGSEHEWNKIAGEELDLTLKGIQLGRRELPQQSVAFVPENPKL